MVEFVLMMIGLLMLAAPLAQYVDSRRVVRLRHLSVERAIRRESEIEAFRQRRGSLPEDDWDPFA